MAGFDWRRTSARRTVFTVDYWSGVPAIDKEGRSDMRTDLEHLKAYADPATVRTLAFAHRPAPPAEESEARGWLTIPDVLHSSPAALAGMAAQSTGDTRAPARARQKRRICQGLQELRWSFISVYSGPRAEA